MKRTNSETPMFKAITDQQRRNAAADLENAWRVAYKSHAVYQCDAALIENNTLKNQCAQLQIQLEIINAQLHASMLNESRYLWLRSQPEIVDDARVDVTFWTPDEYGAENTGIALRGGHLDHIVDLSMRYDALQKDAVADSDEPLRCDICGVECPDPWHFSSKKDKHLHACDNCWTDRVEDFLNSLNC